MGYIYFFWKGGIAVKEKIIATHSQQMHALRRVEGQIRGIQRMVEKKSYCIDIITQIHAAVHALYRVSDKILARHLENCVLGTARSGTKKQAKEKIEEVMKMIKTLHKIE